MNTSVNLPLLLTALSVQGADVTVFVNITVPPGFSLIGVPVTTGGNTVSDVFPRVAAGTEIYKWEQGHFTTNTFTDGSVWSSPDQTVLPGEAVFLFNPGKQTQTLTLAGQVVPLPATNAIPAEISAISPKFPLAGGVTTRGQLRLSPFDNLYLWRNNHFDVFTFLPTGKWFPSEPQVEGGSGFFVNAAVATNWVFFGAAP